MKAMRLWGFGVVCVLLASPALARDLKTASGEVYKNITVTKKDGTGIQISHDEGVIFLDFRLLTEAQRKEFGYAQEAYVAAWKQKAEAEQARRAQALARRQAAAARAQEQATAQAEEPRDLAPRVYQPTNQTGVKMTLDAPGFKYGPYDYTGSGFSNVFTPQQGGTLVPTPYNANGPYPYYYGPTMGPTIIRRR